VSAVRERPEELQAKAAVLHEALPWIKRFAGHTVVIKYGGAAMAPPASPPSGHEEETALGAADLDSFVDDVALLRYVGVDLVVVHGGGPEISRAMEQLGRRPVFVDGQRVTDAETMDLVRMVLVGRINKTLVGRLNRHGRMAVGLSGEDGLLVTARPRRDPGGRDLGFVGDVDAVDPTALRALTGVGLIPVIATVAAGPDGQPYNVNADAVAGAVAASLDAEKLVYLTDVEGLYRDLADPASLYSRMTLAEVEALLAGGGLHSGMIPKLRGVATALRSGVRSAHILDGRRRHALLLELFTDRGVGTMIGPAPEGPEDPQGGSPVHRAKPTKDLRTW
jgi:acetylglutamate kinase